MSVEGDIAEDDDRVLAAEYVLGLLEMPFLKDFEARLAGDPDLRAEVALWEMHFAAFADAVPEVPAPATVWEGITRQLFGVEEEPSFWSRIGVFQVLAGVAVAVLVAFAVMQTGMLSPVSTSGFQADIAAADSDLHFTAEYDVDSGALHLTRVSGAAAPGRSLEIWLIAGDAAPVSVMVWPHQSDIEEIVLPAPMAAALPRATLAISDEPEGGSPTGAPTGAVLATGEVKRL